MRAALRKEAPHLLERAATGAELSSLCGKQVGRHDVSVDESKRYYRIEMWSRVVKHRPFLIPWCSHDLYENAT